MRHRENDDDLLMERYQNVMKNNDIFSDNNDSFVCKMSNLCECVCVCESRANGSHHERNMDGKN